MISLSCFILRRGATHEARSLKYCSLRNSLSSYKAGPAVVTLSASTRHTVTNMEGRPYELLLDICVRSYNDVLNNLYVLAGTTDHRLDSVCPVGSRGLGLCIHFFSNRQNQASMQKCLYDVYYEMSLAVMQCPLWPGVTRSSSSNVFLDGSNALNCFRSSLSWYYSSGYHCIEPETRSVACWYHGHLYVQKAFVSRSCQYIFSFLEDHSGYRLIQAEVGPVVNSQGRLVRTSDTMPFSSELWNTRG